MTELPGVGQPADAGERDEHEPERQAGRAPASAAPGRASSGDELRALRNPHPAAGADQVGGVLPVGGQRGEARYGRDQARARHRAASEGGDRGATRVRRPAGRAESSAQVAPPRAGSAGVFLGVRHQAAWGGMFRSTRAPPTPLPAEARLAGTGHWHTGTLAGPARPASGRATHLQHTRLQVLEENYLLLRQTKTLAFPLCR